MSAILLVSIAVRICAVFYSLYVVKWTKDRRAGILTLMLFLMASRQILTLYTGFQGWNVRFTTYLTEIPGLVVSCVSLFVVHLVYKMVSDTREREKSTLESEASYRLLAENVRDVIWTSDLDLNLSYVSPSVTKIFGYTPEEVIGRGPKSLGPPAAIEKLEQALIVELENHSLDPEKPNESSQFSLQLDRKDGSSFFAEVVTTFLRNHDGVPAGILGVTRDISARKRVEDALQAEQAHTRNRLEAMKAQQQDLLEISAHQSIIDGKLNDFSRMVTEIVSETINVGRVSIWTLEENNTRLECLDLYEKSAGEHTTAGSLNMQDFPAYFEAILTGHSIDAHDAARDPRTLDFLESYLIPNRVSSMLDAPIRVHGNVFGVVCHEAVDGVRHWEADEVAFAGAVAEQVAQAVLNAERHEAAAHELELERRLAQAQRLESLGTLAGGVAHDFNNSLQVIGSYLNLVRRRLERPEDEVLEFLSEIEKAANHSAELVSQILMFSHNSEIELTPLELDTIVEDAIRFLRNTVPSMIRFERTIDSDIGVVSANEAQIHQILTNLVTNAMHALEDKGGVVTIALNSVTFDTPTNTPVGVIQPGSYVQLSVTDNGAGIPDALHSRLFDPFFTTKAVGKGTGLGLAMVHGSVMSMGGAVDIDSRVGEGTTIRLLFPILEGVRSVEVPEDEALETPFSGGRLLIVDDEEIVAKPVTLYFRDRGFEVDYVTDVESARELIESNPDRFDLALLDYTMPGKTGIELAADFYRLNPNLPIFILSGNLNDINLKTSGTTNIVELIAKPFDLNDLEAVVSRALSRTKSQSRNY